MGVPAGNRPAVPRDWIRGVPEGSVAGIDTRGRQEGRPYLWSQQVIHEIIRAKCKEEIPFYCSSPATPAVPPGRDGECARCSIFKDLF